MWQGLTHNDKIFLRTKIKDQSSYDKTPYLDRGDNDIQSPRAKEHKVQ
jgi:hypothetical protein